MDHVDFLPANRHRQEEVKHNIYFESLPRPRVFLRGFGGGVDFCIFLRQRRGRSLLFVIYSEDTHPSL